MSGIKVMGVKLLTGISKNSFIQSLQKIPSDWREGVLRYHQMSDRQLSLAGRLLLLNMMKLYGIKYHGKLERAEKGKLYFPTLPTFDFSLSHSGQMVICASSNTCSLGIDLEHRREIDFKFVKNVMSSEQWSDIHLSQNPGRTFLEFWTKKEAIAKALGMGLYIPFHEIDVEQNPVKCGNQFWNIREIAADPNYRCHLAYSQISSDTIDVVIIDQSEVFLPD